MVKLANTACQDAPQVTEHMQEAVSAAVNPTPSGIRLFTVQFWFSRASVTSPACQPTCAQTLVQLNEMPRCRIWCDRTDPETRPHDSPIPEKAAGSGPEPRCGVVFLLANIG